MTAMGTAMGEETANMIQPFWALPILAIARLGIKDIMGYCVIGMIIGLIAYSAALLVFARAGGWGAKPARRVRRDAAGRTW
jgi:short-chain fatty acids transporter